MTAEELLRNALMREHEKRIKLAEDGERMSVAIDCVYERSAFEAQWKAACELDMGAVGAAVFALAEVDP